MNQPFYPDDFQTPTWRKTEQHLLALLAMARSQLEAPGLDEKPNSSVRLRARISLLKQLLDLPTQQRPDDADD